MIYSKHSFFLAITYLLLKYLLSIYYQFLLNLIWSIPEAVLPLISLKDYSMVKPFMCVIHNRPTLLPWIPGVSVVQELRLITVELT